MFACLFLIAFIPFTTNATETPQPYYAPSFAESFPLRQGSGGQVGGHGKATKGEPSSITISNNIKPDMLTYKHWTGKYNPDSFKVSVNNSEVAQGATLQIPSETKTVNVTFDYSFVNGKRTGSKTVAYKLNDDATQANITFSWDNDNKIIIDNGTAIAS